MHGAADAEAERPHRPAADHRRSDNARGISQRVMFPEGVEIDPGLTVAMNDDSLYGWIAPGQSKPLPHGRGSASAATGRASSRLTHGASSAPSPTAPRRSPRPRRYHGESASTSVRRARPLRPQRPEGRRRDGPGLPARRLQLRRDPPARRHARAAGDRQRAHGQRWTSRRPRAFRARRPITSTGPDGIVATYTVQLRPGGDGRRVRRLHARPEVDGRATEPGEPRPSAAAR